MIHLGNLIGSLLSADVFARYLRLRGEEVLYVTGSDQHGTPIEVEALKMRIPPEKLAMKNHEKLVEVLKRFRISTDNYTYTHNPVHIEFVKAFYRKLYDNGYIFEREEEVLYCEKDKIFLPDRFVIGTCPYCGYEYAKGDQCENCKALLSPRELKNAKCVICGEKPIVKRTTHWYFDLPKFSEKLSKFIKSSKTLTENAKKFSLQMIETGLSPRSVTRDNTWGIPAPFPGAEGKVIYVWMEAVLGYISAVIEYFQKKGDEESWKKYWLDKETKIMFFIGKDNIPFHTIIFPALLMATGEDYDLNFYVAATEFLMFEGKKFSKSRRIGIWLDEALEILPADYWRFALMMIRPEVGDTNFTWDFLEKTVNEDLNNQLGNLVNRVLALIERYFKGEIPQPKQMGRMEISLLNETIKTKREVEKFFEEFRLQRALVSIMNLVRKCNVFLNIQEPWRKAKRDDIRNTLYAIAFTLKAIAIMLLPFIPDTGEKMLRYLGLNPEEITWDSIETDFPEKTMIIKDFKPLFKKINAERLKRKLEKIRGEKLVKS